MLAIPTCPRFDSSSVHAHDPSLTLLFFIYVLCVHESIIVVFPSGGRSALANLDSL